MNIRPSNPSANQLLDRNKWGGRGSRCKESSSMTVSSTVKPQMQTVHG